MDQHSSVVGGVPGPILVEGFAGSPEAARLREVEELPTLRLPGTAVAGDLVAAEQVLSRAARPVAMGFDDPAPAVVVELDHGAVADRRANVHGHDGLRQDLVGQAGMHILRQTTHGRQGEARKRSPFAVGQAAERCRLATALEIDAGCVPATPGYGLRIRVRTSKAQWPDEYDLVGVDASSGVQLEFVLLADAL